MALLSAFNPHEFSEATVRTVATGRDDDLADILATIRANLACETIQHLIVSAPRGYGKSFMMRHVQIEVERIARDEALSLAVVLMPEEMPHVKEPETLVRELTRALTGGAGAEAELTWHEDEGSAWEDAIAGLEVAIADKVGAQGLVVALVENFDVLLRRAFPKPVQAARLRNLLTARGGRLMLIAASASGAFDRNYDAPLFQAFREVGLTPWTIEECLAFFDRQRAAAGKPPLDDLVRARAKAVASFIGGTPRLATLLGEVLFDEDVLRAADLLQELIDELTPYYKERVEALAGRSQKLLDALLRGGEPATPSEIARRVKASSQAAIAGPFNDLARERLVLGEKVHGSAEVLYRVADRVFAQYYRRRVINHGGKACPLEAMVELLATYFSADEKKTKAAEFARLGLLREARIMARLHVADRGADDARKSRLLHHLVRFYGPRRLVPLASERVARQLHTIFDWIKQDRVGEYYERIEAMLAPLDPNDRVLMLLARARIDAAEGIDNGRSAADEAEGIADKHGLSKLTTLVRLGQAWTLNYETKYVDALEKSTEAAEHATDTRGMADALRYGAFSLGQLGRHEEAIESALRAADLAITAGDIYEAAVALRRGAYSLRQLGRHKEAIESARRAVDLATEAGDAYETAAALSLIAYSLGQLGRHEDAVESARRAADLAAETEAVGEAAMALRHGAYSLQELGHRDEAAEMAREATDLAKRSGDIDLLDELAWNFAEIEEQAFDALSAAAEIQDRHRSERNAQSLPTTSRRIAWRQSTLFAGDQFDAERLHVLLGVLADRLDRDGVRRLLLQKWIREFAHESAARNPVADRLETLASAVDLRFPGRFGAETFLLRDAARYHRSGRDPSVLARLDPDVARTLRIMFPPANGTSPTAEKRKSARRRKH